MTHERNMGLETVVGFAFGLLAAEGYSVDDLQRVAAEALTAVKAVGA